LFAGNLLLESAGGPAAWVSFQPKAVAVVTRRLFLRNALLVSAATWAVGLGAIGLVRKLRVWFFPRRLPEPVLAWLAAPGAGAEAGRSLALRPHERRDLVTRTEAFLTAAAAAQQPLAETLRTRIEADFAAGRLVVADGWYLAEAEAGVFLLQADIDRGLYRAS
jgi:hypothetical protein